MTNYFNNTLLNISWMFWFKLVKMDTLMINQHDKTKLKTQSNNRNAFDSVYNFKFVNEADGRNIYSNVNLQQKISF